MSEPFRKTFVAEPHHIDVMGHVNNAVWVQWIQNIAVSHWEAVAPAEHQETYVWLVTRHEIDYRGNIAEGESVTGETFIPGEPRGARFDRRVDFRNADGKVIVSANTTWVMLDRETGRPARIRGDVTAAFLG
ncbi:acyl-CoA thioesterase [Qipengyuania sp. JC766]|uniref:acyl-CoA thioesterase n=1 Tax=Qipengyuania sp. JC766 TaxID=3232139 RepID=UPI00345A0133